MTSCLLGATGFVGRNLLASHTFDAALDSRSVKDAHGHVFDLVVCAAPQARKWWANQHPDEDQAIVAGLIGDLARIRAGRFVLVSTIDVFPRLDGVDESFDCGSLHNHPYGRHRLALEHYVARRFATHHIVRLPGLFGPGLKKNVLFDLLHAHELEKINPESRFQWYDVGRLWADLDAIIRHELRLVALATEPVRTGDIAAEFFPALVIGPGAGPPAAYDVRTRHAEAFGGARGYMMDRHTVLRLVGEYVAHERGHEA